MNDFIEFMQSRGEYHFGTACSLAVRTEAAKQLWGDRQRAIGYADENQRVHFEEKCLRYRVSSFHTNIIKERKIRLISKQAFFHYITVFYYPLLIYLSMSFICFFAYAIDKYTARKRRVRVSEKWLHLLELLGGWPGGLLAQIILRHKNRKLSYQMEFLLIVFIHFLVWFFYWDLST